MNVGEHKAIPKPPPEERETRLPIWTSCVFIDWHGVLSEEVFWASILDNDTHELKGSLGRAVRSLFEGERELVERWMRGAVTMDHVVARLDVGLSRRYRTDFLVRRLLEDCQSMQPRRSLLEPLLERETETKILRTLATDNMDCFFSGAERLWKSPKPLFDGVLCSSELGVLKAEDPERFFGGWLEARGLEPADAVLIDDSSENCLAFERWGGTAVHYSSEKRAVSELRAWLGETPNP